MGAEQVRGEAMGSAVQRGMNAAVADLLDRMGFEVEPLRVGGLLPGHRPPHHEVTDTPTARVTHRRPRTLRGVSAAESPESTRVRSRPCRHVAASARQVIVPPAILRND